MSSKNRISKKVDKILPDVKEFKEAILDSVDRMKLESKSTLPVITDDNFDKLHTKHQDKKVWLRNEIFRLIEESDGKVDKYGLPMAVSLEDGISKILKTSIDAEEARNKIIADIEDTGDYAMYDKYPQLVDESIAELYEFSMNEAPVLLDKLGWWYGSIFQTAVKTEIKPIVDESIIPTSAKYGKTYNKKRDAEFVELLMPYWEWRVNDVTMPDGHNRDSLFTEIAENYKISRSRVKQIERRLFPKHKPPERNLTD